MLKRDPETFASFVRSAAENGPMPQVFIDANALQQSGVADQVVAASPAVAEQYPQALATGGTVAIPTEEYATRIAPTDLNAPLIEHLRTDPDGFSRAEAAQYLEARGAQLQAEMARALTDEQAEGAFKRSADAVRATVQSELDTTGRFTSPVNAAYSSLVGNFYAVQAARLGITPEELYRRYPLRVVAQDVTSAQALQQSDFTPTEQAVADWQRSLAKAVGNPQAKAPKLPTPAVLRAMGEKSPSLEFPVTYLRTVHAEHPDVPTEVFEKLPALLHDPLFVIPHKEGGASVVLNARSTSGSPLVAGVRDGRVRTITPMDGGLGQTSAERLAKLVNNALGRRDARVYARNEEALVKTKASEGAAPGLIPMHRSIPNGARVFTRASLVNRLGENYYQSGNARHQGQVAATITGTEFGPADAPVEQLRANARNWYVEHLQTTGAHGNAPIVNAASGREINVPRPGKAFSTSASVDKVRLFAALPELLRHGRIVSSKAPKNQKRGSAVRAYHWLEGTVDLGGRLVRVGVTLREDNSGHLYYNHNPINEVPGTVQGGDPAHKAGVYKDGSGAYGQSMVPEADGVNLYVLGQGAAAEDQGPFGPIYRQFKGNAQGAIAKLIEQQDGEAQGALHHPSVGDIDLVWGESGTGRSDGYGLAKLVKYHPEVLGNLQGIISDMRVVSRNKNRVNLESDNYRAGVRLTWDDQSKNWLLTAFRKKRGDVSGTTTDTATSNGEGGTARFSDASDKIVDDRVKKYYQEQKSTAPRGVFAPSSYTIALLKNADLSTFLHESGHAFLEMQMDMAARIEGMQRDGASLSAGEEQILADARALLKWFGNGVESLDEWQAMPLEEKRSSHEQFARGFEAYLFEGKAPSLELAGVFQRFRAWLVHVYKSLKKLKVTLTPEVRGVMERMLASTEQIELAEQGRSMLPLFSRPEQAGMTPAEFAAYQALGVDASNDAIQELQHRGLADMKWLNNARSGMLGKLQRRAAAQRREVRMQVRREVMSAPVYRAWTFLTGKIGEEDRLPEIKPPGTSTDIDATRDSLFTAIAKFGGLRKDEAVSQWGLDPKERLGQPVFGKPILRVTEGLALDAMAERLREAGYLLPDEDLNDFEEKFAAELRGTPQYSIAHEYRREARAGEQIANPAGLNAGRLDLPELRGMHLADEIVTALQKRKMTARNGLHPDIVADLFGFTSGDELVRALAAVDPTPCILSPTRGASRPASRRAWQRSSAAWALHRSAPVPCHVDRETAALLAAVSGSTRRGSTGIMRPPWRTAASVQLDMRRRMASPGRLARTLSIAIWLGP